ncbi:MAG: glycosyltransferase [Actinobacteria bacterium]|nr:glycosyltransferase [Actinomycetota bacterium]
MSKASVIVPSYRSGKKLIDCIASILESKEAPDFDIWIVDSSEEDLEPTLGNLLKDERLHLVKGGRRLFPGEARDLGARTSSGDILVFTDADCVATPLWLKNIVEGLIDSGGDACGGPIENGTPNSYIGTVEYLSEFSGFTPRSPERKDRFVPTCNMAIYRSSYFEVGGFPFDREKGSDVAFGRKLTDAGKDIYFISKPVIRHINRTSSMDYVRNQFRLGKGFAANLTSGIMSFSWVSTNPLTLSFFLAAVFPARLGRISSRALINRELKAIGLLYYLPGLMLGAAGFATGCLAFFLSEKRRRFKRGRG